MKYQDLDPYDQKRVRHQVVPIYHWIEANKHKFRYGITRSKQFAHVLPLGDDTNECFPPDLKQGDPLYGKLGNHVSYLRRKGLLIYKKLAPNQPATWQVNESILPPGTVTYTGVQHVIPTPTEVVKPKAEPVVIEPKVDPAEVGAEFIANELKTIKLREATLASRNKAMVQLTDVSLYEVYKIGLSLHNTLGTDFTPTTSPESSPACEDFAEEEAPF